MTELVPISESLGENVRNRIRKTAQGYKKLRKAEIRPMSNHTHFCYFNSRDKMEIWTFCSQNQISFTDYIIEYAKIHDRHLDNSFFDEPLTHKLEANDDILTEKDIKEGKVLYLGKVSFTVFDNYQTVINNRKVCKICWNTGWAYTVRDILLSDKLVPGKLGRTLCWCKR